MKQILLMVAAAAMIISCNKAGENEYVVTGNIKGIDNGKNVFLEMQDSTGQLKQVDTVKIKDGKFTFTGKADEPALNLVQVEGINGKVPFILENGNIEMTINKDSVAVTKVSGTYNNDELSKYKADGMAIQKRMMKFQQDNMARMNQAQQTKDTAAIGSLRRDYAKFQQEFAKQSDDYVSAHPKAFISALIIESMFNQMMPDVPKIKKYYDALDASVKNTKPGKAIKSKLDQMGKPKQDGTGTAVGNVAPDFSAPDPSGKVVSLKQSMGKLTIIDFWASWCKPCRAEMPNVVSLYKDYHAKGLNIIGVSLDKDAADWKAAIAKDGITWTQVSNLKEWKEPIAALYGVEAIPATFIIDASGKVVARDLTGDALRSKVAELLK